MSVLTEQFNINIPIATVMTDYRMHKNWITPDSQRYYVATEDTKDDFVEAGVPASHIKVTESLLLISLKTPLIKKLGCLASFRSKQTNYLNVSRCIWSF